MRADLQKAIGRAWSNSVVSFGMQSYIEKTITDSENVLYAAKAKITVGSSIDGQTITVYDLNRNISGMLIVTTQAVWHFSQRDTGMTFEIMSLDDTNLELKKSMFSSFIRLQSSAGVSVMDIIGLNTTETNTIVKLISDSIALIKLPLEPKKKRRKSKA